uniref:Erbb2 interacting protein n=1 Tax=Gongylonema pulchrum TaxID=637853 RepID=A0A183ETS2_9BILA
LVTAIPPSQHRNFVVPGSTDAPSVPVCLSSSSPSQPAAAPTPTHTVTFHGRTTPDLHICEFRKDAPDESRPENTPRRLRLKTSSDGAPPRPPSFAPRSSYSRPATWQDGPPPPPPRRQSSTFFISNPSTAPATAAGARIYTRPAPSLPLLPLGQAYSRSNSQRRFPVETQTRYGNDTFNNESLYGYKSLQGFRSNREGNDTIRKSFLTATGHVIAGSTTVQTAYGCANITYTAAGTA